MMQVHVMLQRTDINGMTDIHIFSKQMIMENHGSKLPMALQMNHSRAAFAKTLIAKVCFMQERRKAFMYHLMMAKIGSHSSLTFLLLLCMIFRFKQEITTL